MRRLRSQILRVGRSVLLVVLAVSGAFLGAMLLQSAREAVVTQRGPALSGPTTHPSAATPFNEQAAIAERASPRPAHVPTRFHAGTPGEVLAGLQKNPDWELLMASLTNGPERDARTSGQRPTTAEPVYVRALESGATDEWLIPLQVQGNTIALVWVSLDRAQPRTGYVGGMAQWDGVFPKIQEADARRLGAAQNDPVATAELAWAYLSRSADRFQPFWRLVRQSGAVFFLFDGGRLESASNYTIP